MEKLPKISQILLFFLIFVLNVNCLKLTNNIAKSFHNFESTQSIPPKQPGSKRIVILGDSTTIGAQSSFPPKTSWPAQFYDLMDSSQNNDVILAAYSARTVSRKSGKAFMDMKQYQDTLQSQPDIVIIQLGMNDSKDGNWDKIQFQKDYALMVKQIQALDTKPSIFMITPQPLYKNGASFMRQNITNSILPKLMPQMAKEMGIPPQNVINMFELMGGKELSHPEYFPDFIHCNDEGYHFMAEEIFLVIAQKIIQELNESMQNKYMSNSLPDSVDEAIKERRGREINLSSG